MKKNMIIANVLLALFIFASTYAYIEFDLFKAVLAGSIGLEQHPMIALSFVNSIVVLMVYFAKPELNPWGFTEKK